MWGENFSSCGYHIKGLIGKTGSTGAVTGSHLTINPILDTAHIAAPSGIGLVHQISSNTANIDITIMVNIKRGLTKVSHIYVIISIKNLTYNIVTVIVQKCQRQKMLFQYVPLEVKCNQYHASGMIHISVWRGIVACGGQQGVEVIAIVIAGLW